MIDIQSQTTSELYEYYRLRCTQLGTTPLSYKLWLKRRQEIIKHK